MSMHELIVLHYDWICRKAQYYYHNESDAYDLASETMYKCLCSHKKYDAMRDFKPWVHVIMENTFKSQLRVRQTVSFIGLDACRDVCFSESSTDSSAEIKAILSTIRETRRASKCIDVVLLYAKGYSYAEIAAQTGIPVGTVKSRIASGRKLLTKAFGLGTVSKC